MQVWKSLRLEFAHSGERRTENGQEYFVIPGVGVRAPMVLNRRLLPRDQFEQSINEWNGVDVSIDHWFFNASGEHNRAIDASRHVGTVRNARMEAGDFRCEVWIPLPNANEEVQALVERVENGETIEVSTGFYAGLSHEAGEYDGREYDAVLHSITPNHLALLPHDIGACSIADGCGAGEAMAASEQEVINLNFALPGSLGRRMSLVRDAIVQKWGPSPEESDRPWPFVEDVYMDSILIDQGDTLFRASYTLTEVDGKESVTLGERERVPMSELQSLAQPSQAVAAIRNSARRPTFNGTEAGAWRRPSLGTFIAGYYRAQGRQRPEGIKNVGDLTTDAKRWIARRTLLGEETATDVANLISFPVVNPSTNKLNRAALQNAIARAPRANLEASTAESVRNTARSLLTEFSNAHELQAPVRLSKETNNMDRTALIEVIHKQANIAVDVLETWEDETLSQVANNLKVENSEGCERKQLAAKLNVEPEAVANVSIENLRKMANSVNVPATLETAETPDPLSDEERAALQNVVEIDKSKRTKLVAALVANKSVPLGEETLRAMPLDELEALEATHRPHIYAGAPGIANVAEDDEEARNAAFASVVPPA